MAAPNFHNRTLFHGDNLAFLRNINSECVDLIATDPPFNKGRDFHATPDSLAAGAKFQDRWSWANDVEGEWVDRITDDWPNVMTVINGARTSYGDDMGAFLCFMAVRLLEMRRVLKPTGSIYLHCDPTASHYLKALMDGVFGRKNLRNEVVWCYTSGGVSKRWFGRKHDVILFYSKSMKYHFNIQYRPYSAGTIQRGLTQYKKRLNEKYELSEKGAIQNDWWADIQPVLSPTSRERQGYPTQKPLALYERIIKASSNEGDMVLDPFCGCATTPIAAERLSRQWAGMDIWDGAHNMVIDRLKDEGLAGPDGTTDRLITFGQVYYQTTPPERTDAGEEAVPFLQVTEKYAEPGGPKMSRADMYEYLLAQRGQRCQGCDRTFDDPRYLELDHNTPRSDGGLNHITNRVLLCGPCNKVKSNTYTLSGLRRQNRRNGWMANKS